MIIRAKAPLRLGLAGGGTDLVSYYSVYGGCILNAAIDLYAYCTIEPADDGAVSFTATDYGSTLCCEASGRLDTDTTMMLHAGVYNRIIADFTHGAPLSFKMTTYSDAPAGSGLGSSSTIIVAMLKAYTEWLNLPLGEYDIADLAYRIERVDLGLAGGRQDQYAATFGGFNFMEFYKDDKVIVNPLRLKRWVRNELENSIILCYTGVSRESARIIEQQIKSTGENKAKNIEGMHELKKQAVLMKEALLKGDFKVFASCLNQGWLAKKSIADAISNPLIDELCGYALSNGAEAAKISGAGGGGFMILYCDPCSRIKLIGALKERDLTVLTPSFTEIGAQAWTLYSN
jgi:D-glycero-alpha-D-manno-heptose-7-phosphate kinase